MYLETEIHEKTIEAIEDQAEELMRRLEILSGSRAHDNISFGQYRVMAVINAHETISIGTLGRLVGSAQSTTSEMVARLTKTEMVTKVRGPDDGRVVLVELTDQGRQLMQRRKKNLREAYSNLLDALEPDEKKRFIDSLCALNELLAGADLE